MSQERQRLAAIPSRLPTLLVLVALSGLAVRAGLGATQAATPADAVQQVAAAFRDGDLDTAASLFAEPLGSEMVQALAALRRLPASGARVRERVVARWGKERGDEVGHDDRVAPNVKAIAELTSHVTSASVETSEADGDRFRLVVSAGFKDGDNVRTERVRLIAQQEGGGFKLKVEAMENNRDFRKTLADLRGLPDVLDRLSRDLEAGRLPSWAAFKREMEWGADSRLVESQKAPRAHPEAVGSVTFSPDGRLIATGGRDGSIRLWEAADGRPASTLPGHDGMVWGLAFAPDGRRLASAGTDGDVILWDVAKGKPERAVPGHLKAARALAFSPNGRWIASASDGLELWSTEDGSLRTLTSASGNIRATAFSPDGSTLAWATDAGGPIHLWDVASGKETATLGGGEGAFWCLAFSPDGRSLAAGRDSRGHGGVELWDLGERNMRTSLYGHERGTSSVAFSLDGKNLVTGGADEVVRLWDVGRAALVSEIGIHVGGVWSVAFSPDGKTIATAGEDGVVRLWDAGTRRFRLALRGQTEIAGALAVSPDGATVAFSLGEAGRKGEVVLARAQDGHRLASLAGNERPVNGIAFSDDGRRVASAGEDWTVRVWDRPTGRAVAVLMGHLGAVKAVAFTAHGTSLVSSGTDGLRAWDLPQQKETRFVPAESTAATFSANGEALLTLHWGAHLWNLTTWKEGARLEGHKASVVAAAFSPDAKTLATASRDESAVALWAVAQAKETALLPASIHEVGGLAFSPEGKTLAVASGRKVRIWDIATQQSSQTLMGAPRVLTSLVFANGGHSLLATGFDGTVRAWDIATGNGRELWPRAQGAAR